MSKTSPGLQNAEHSSSNPVLLFINRYAEWLLLALLFFGSWGFFYATIGSAYNVDSYLYMDLGIMPRLTGAILNRWAHIYFQKLFMDLAVTPMQGAKLFWGFVISATLIVVYLAGKKVRKDSNSFNGIVAALFFGSSFLISKYPGDTLSDYTAMFFVAVGFLVFLLYLRADPRRNWWILILFGFIFFTATKSKESGFVLATLILGVGFSNNRFDLKLFLKNAVYIAIGVLLAFGVLALLDSLFVNNAAASLDPAALSQYSSFVLKSGDLEVGVSNRLERIFGNLADSILQYGVPWVQRLFTTIPLFVSLYLVTFGVLIRDLSQQRKRRMVEVLLWSMPIVFIGLLVLGAVAAKDRHFFPMHPLLVILGAQFFTAPNRIDFRQTFAKIWSVIKQPTVVASIIVLSLYAILKNAMVLKVQSLYLGLVVTSAEIAIILMAIWVKKWSSYLVTAALALVFLYSSYGIVFSNIYPLASGQIAAESAARLRPLAEIADSFECSPETRIYVSTNVAVDHNLATHDTVYRVYFECDLANNQFHLAQEPLLPDDLLVDGPYSFAYITAKEFKAMSSIEQEQLAAVYSYEYIEDGKLVLLRY